MSMQEDPLVGKVYENDEGLQFKVTAYDQDEGVIELRYEDGSVDEIDIDTWREMDLAKVEAENDRSANYRRRPESDYDEDELEDVTDDADDYNEDDDDY
jgi:hypothetical protein